jgi:ketosteroid isomerase-like protein
MPNDDTLGHVSIKGLAMTVPEHFGKAVIIAAVALGTSAGVAWSGHRQVSARDRQEQQDRAAIERLHALDVSTTLTDKADLLAKLWDKDAVRLEPGHPVEVGKAVIYADDKKWEQTKGRYRTLSYVSDIKDVQIVGDWAFEWGIPTGSYRDSTGKIFHIRGKQLRVMKRQPDGEWKFARVMGVIDERQ